MSNPKFNAAASLTWKRDLAEGETTPPLKIEVKRSSRPIACPTCHGTGAHAWRGAWFGVQMPPLEECGTCSGTGFAVVVKR